MMRYRLFLCNILIMLVISACITRNVPPAIDDLSGVPSMPPLAALDDEKPPAPVFGPDEEYSGSPVEEVGRRGLFETHGPQSNQFALLDNGDISFTVRAQLIEQAKKSIRIQALIFAGDESGLYLAEIRKGKRPRGWMSG